MNRYRRIISSSPASLNTVFFSLEVEIAHQVDRQRDQPGYGIGQIEHVQRGIEGIDQRDPQQSEHARPHLYNHPVKTIDLPATSVGKGAYRRMFAFCTNMTVAPELPATTFTGGPYTAVENDQPYGFMFINCTSLRKAPSILPATTVPAYTYMSMFDLCESLEATPVLPAQNPGKTRAIDDTF